MRTAKGPRGNIPDEIGRVLGEEDGGHFCRWYGITRPGNFEGKSVPNLLEQPEFDREPEGMAAHPGKLDDYAFYAYGLPELYGATFDISYLSRAGSLADRLLERFFDGEHGGFYPYASDGEQLLTRTKEAYDGAMPSGNSVAALVLSRPARLTGDGRWREAVDLHLRWLAGAAAAPFTKSYPIPEQGARYYLCRNGACAQPVDRISEPEALWEPN